ncbi:MAG: dynamin family protein [SAR324 cluster bacterium]|nr:dynamin family protein [SAR324 cluster bacterium]
MPDGSSSGLSLFPPLAETRSQLEKLAELLQWKDAPQLRHWQETLQHAEARLQQAKVRIAVLGAVKSGKSTLLNALLGADRLRRGAGILTSIVTRVQPGEISRAHLRFKSKSLLDRQFQAALAFLQSSDSSLPSCELDHASERQSVLHWLDEQPVAEDTSHFGEERAFLRACLVGYSEAVGYLSNSTEVQTWSGEESYQHQAWVEQDARAVFLEALLLEEPGWTWQGTEIADCQGSDSPNPLHFVQVQEYASRSNLLIYVISSRIGIRQADVRLLRNLHQLGLADQTIFVINLDLNEHEEQADVGRITEQILRDLRQCGWQQPHYFTLSALHLLLQRKLELTTREQKQLEFWQDHPVFHTSANAWKIFQEELHLRLVHQQSQTLLAGEWSHWQRLHRQVSEFVERLQATLSAENLDWEEWQSELQHRQRYLRYHEQNLQHTLKGGEKKWRQHIDHGVRALFDRQEGKIWSSLERFLKQLELTSPKDNFSPNIQSMLWVQEVREQLLRWVVDEINVSLLPEIARLRSEITVLVNQAVEPFFEVLDELQQKEYQLHSRLQKGSLSSIESPKVYWQFPEIEPISFTTTLAFQTPEQLRSWLLYGQSWFRALWRKERNLQREFHQQSQRELKRQLLENLDFDVLNYQENLKYRYLWSGTQQLLETILVCWQESARGCQADLSGLMGQLEKLRSEQKQLMPLLLQWQSNWRELSIRSLPV